MKKIFFLVALCLLSVMSIKAQSKQSYLVVDQTNGVITYYYDANRSTHTNSYDVPIPGTSTLSYNDFWFNIAKWATKIVIDPSFKDYHPTTAYNLFYQYDESHNSYGVMANTTRIEGLENLNTSYMKDMSSLFFGMSKIETLDVRFLDVQNVETANSMFEKCESLKTIYCNTDWSKISKITNTAISIFFGCTSLKGGNGTTYSNDNKSFKYARPDKAGEPGYFTAVQPLLYSKYDPSTHVLTYYYDGNYNKLDPMTTVMSDPDQQKFLDYAEDIKKIVIDPSVADGQPVNLSGIFSTNKSDKPMTSMTEIEGLEYIDCTRLTNIAYMFCDCQALKKVDLSHFNTSKVTDMSGMFYNCHSLESLDLNNFVMSNVTTVSGMFTSCRNLKTIYCKTDWTQYTMDADDLFYDCPKLVGGNGTVYDENHTYLDYARPDLPNQPGYFSDGTPHAINNLTANGKCENGKFLRNGQLYIQHGDELFNAQGTRVK